jgi:glycosyltransferase involved in cell wall biosynthesis
MGTAPTRRAEGLSAVLITRDAEEHLDRVLRSLNVCGEIVILDSGSIDRTREIAAAHGARWYERPFSGYGPQKQLAVSLAVNDWILAVDADEILDAEATSALCGVPWSRQDPAACWRINRRPFIGRREIRHTHWVPDRVVRIFNRGCHAFSDVAVHESIVPTGPLYDLPGSCLHYSYRDLGEVFRMDYHRLKSISYRAAGRRASGPQLAIRAAWRFFYSYVVRRGVLDGRAGVVIALAGSVNAVMGLALAGEMESHETE